MSRPALLLVLVFANCTPQDVLNRQGQSLVNKDYVQEAIDAKKKDDAKRDDENRVKAAAAADVKKHTDMAQAHMDLFEYEGAAREWKEAFRMTNDPIYLVKVGDAYRATGDCVEAQSMYNQYLTKKKDAADAKAVQAKVGEARSCETRAGNNLDKIRVFYKDGTTHYDLAEYEAAAKDFKEAYRLSNDPAYLFNIGQAYRMAKKCDDAAKFYERFLAVSPDAPNKDKIQIRITEMRACAKGK